MIWGFPTRIYFSGPTINKLFFLPGIYPIHVESKDYVLAQKRACFDDLKHALRVMRYIDDKTPKTKCFSLMFQIEKKTTLFNYNTPASEANFMKIADCLLGVFDSNDVETYFMAKKFYRFSEEVEAELPRLIKITNALLEKQDSELYKWVKLVWFY